MTFALIPLADKAHTVLDTVLRAASVENAMTAALVDTPRPGLVIGGGKAGRAMAQAVHDRYADVTGAVAVPPEHQGQAGPVELLPAGHPLPTEETVAAVERMEGLLREYPDGPLLFLLSGGASAMLGAPVSPLTLDDLRSTYRALLAAGLPVQDMNVVRRHLTRWGGGKLARLLQGRECRALIVSDVLGDQLEAIGSGPLAPDPTTLADAGGLVGNVGGIPEPVVSFLDEAKGVETVKPGEPVLEAVSNRIILSNRTVVQAVAAKLDAEILPNQTDDVTAVAERMAERLRTAGSAKAGTNPTRTWVAGAEPTVRLPENPGRGGRNQQLVLEVARRMEGFDGEWFFATVATDGADGNSGNAGGWCASGRAPASADIERALAAFDAAALLEKEGLAYRTGPTGSNVADVIVGWSA